MGRRGRTLPPTAHADCSSLTPRIHAVIGTATSTPTSPPSVLATSSNVLGRPRLEDEGWTTSTSPNRGTCRPPSCPTGGAEARPGERCDGSEHQGIEHHLNPVAPGHPGRGALCLQRLLSACDHVSRRRRIRTEQDNGHDQHLAAEHHSCTQTGSEAYRRQPPRSSMTGVVATGTRQASRQRVTVPSALVQDSTPSTPTRFAAP